MYIGALQWYHSLMVLVGIGAFLGFFATLMLCVFVARKDAKRARAQAEASAQRALTSLPPLEGRGAEFDSLYWFDYFAGYDDIQEDT